MAKHLREKANSGELKKHMQTHVEKGRRLVEKWSRTEPGYGLTKLAEGNSAKAQNTARAIENQDRYLRSLSEDTVRSQFKTVPENVLKIVRIGVANRNRGNIFTEIGLETMDDAFYFIERVYGDKGENNSLAQGLSGDRIFDTMPNQYYASEAHKENLGVGTSSKALVTKGIVPFSVKVFANGQQVGVDNGYGGIAGKVEGTIDYAAGQVEITANADNFDLDIEYHFDSETQAAYDAGNYGSVDIQVRRQRFGARPHPLGYSYSDLASAVLESTGLGSLEDELILTVGAEHARRADARALAMAKRIATNNPVVTWNADFASGGGSDAFTYAQSLSIVIDEISNSIYNELQRGEVNTMVAAGKALSFIKKHRLWVSDNSQPRVGATYLAGHLDGKPVYGTPASDMTVGDNEILLTNKNPQEVNEHSIVFGTFTELQASLRYENFMTRAAHAVVEDAMVIQPKFIRLLKLENLGDGQVISGGTGFNNHVNSQADSNNPYWPSTR